MVYRLVMRVDGGCRNNGYANAIGAAAVIEERRWGRTKTYTKILPNTRWNPPPTSQRAELAAVILALSNALQRKQQLDYNPKLDVTIYTDSRYAHNCMTVWYAKWEDNGWLNARGEQVANRDLIQEALDLEQKLLVHGRVDWKWVPRQDNQDADDAVNEALDDAVAD